MKKIDKKLLNFIILGEDECVLEAIVYYLDKTKTQDFLLKNNIKILKELRLIKAFVVCFNSGQLLNTANQNFVYYISSVSNVATLVNVSKKILGADKCNFKGKNITIAFIDTGINSHLDFSLGKNRILIFKDFVNSKKNSYDDNGHGTFVTGVACGSGYVSCKKYSGIAPYCNIISLKALDKKGEATAVTILDAMQWILDNHIKYNISIVCMSFGSEPLGNNDPIMKGAEVLWQEGIVVVSAGGNSGPNNETIKSPGVSKKIITVGGLDDKRDNDGNCDEKLYDIAKFSSRGPAYGRIKPDVIAPSVDIVSCSHMGEYKKMSGTSVATPMIAGLCAIIKEKYPKATPNQIKNFLVSTAKSINKSKFEQGFGIANIFKL